MTILKTDKISKQGILVGTYVTAKTHLYLSLYCAAKSTLKSRILTTLFLEWISQQKTYYSETRLLNMITEKIQAQRTKHPERDLDEFLVKIEDELIKKGIPIEVVGKILSEIK